MYYPEYIASLALESASPGLREESARQERKEKDEQLAQRILENGVEEFVNYWQELPLFTTQKQLPDRVQRKIREERLSQHAEGLAMSLRTMGTGAQPSWWDNLSQLPHPTLLIAGEEDGKFVTMNQKMQSAIPQATFLICPDAGHAVHVEKSRNFGKMVNGFLSKNHLDIKP